VPILKRNTHGAAVPLPLLLPIEIAPPKWEHYSKRGLDFSQNNTKKWFD
jgi:hypothetical protein